jgi:cytochrome c5
MTAEFIEKGTKCDWCGKEATAKTGVVVFNDGRERMGLTCNNCSDAINPGNPVFESETAWQLWKKRHHTLSRRIIDGGGPKYQYSKTRGGDAWEKI